MSSRPAVPNILVVLHDSTRPDVLGCYGDHQRLTPHSDALAAAGVRFDRAYCAAPICHPARADTDMEPELRRCSQRLAEALAAIRDPVMAVSRQQPRPDRWVAGRVL